MFIESYFAETDVEVMRNLIRSFPLATLVTLTGKGLTANHIPLILVETDSSLGILQGHIARANTLWRDFQPEVESVAVFMGTNAYITPRWYATKKEDGRVVPTWNYSTVHAYGKLKIIDDKDWLRSQIEKLTAQQESSAAIPWKLTDAPPDYIEKLFSAVIGIEMEITKLEGKTKASQNHPEKNKKGVMKGLKERGMSEDLMMADLIEADMYGNQK